MNIQITIQATNAADLRNAILALSGMVEVAAAKQPETVTTVAESVRAVNEEVREVIKAAPEQVTPEAVPSPEVIPTDVELRALAAAKAKSAGKQAVKALLDTYNAASITAVPSDRRSDFKIDLEAL